MTLRRIVRVSYLFGCVGLLAVMTGSAVYAAVPGTQKWTFVDGGKVLPGPDDTVYIGSANYDSMSGSGPSPEELAVPESGVYAVDTRTGHKRWSFGLGIWENRPITMVTGAEGWLYLGLVDGRVIALNGKTGAKQWSFSVERGVVSTLRIGKDGTVYTAIDSVVYALDGQTGATLWTFDIKGYWSAFELGPDGTVYVGETEGHLYALNGQTGLTKWAFQAGDGVKLSLRVKSDGTVYLGGGDGRVYSLNGKSGAMNWAFLPGGDPLNGATSLGSAAHFSSLAIGMDGSVYMAGADQVVYALNGNSGARIWTCVPGGHKRDQLSAPMQDTPEPSLTIGAGGIGYLSSYDQKVHALNRVTGKEMWSTPIGGSWARMSSYPAVGSDATFYLGNADGDLCALDGLTGAKKWITKTGSVLLNYPVIGPDGTVYIACSDHTVRAIVGNSQTAPLIPGFWPISSASTSHTSKAPDVARTEEPPKITISRPEPASTVARLTTCAGTVVDKEGHKIESVGLAIQRLSDHRYWNGASWALTLATIPAVIADSTWTCSERLPTGANLPDGYYFLTTFATDRTANMGSSSTVMSVRAAYVPAPGTPKWTFKTGDCVISSPAIGVDGTVYIGSGDHNVYALDGQTGEKKWAFLTERGVNSSPAIGADGTVYVSAGNVFALDAQTGIPKWTSKLGEVGAGSPAIGADGTIYVARGDHNVYALDGKTGEKRWSFDTGGVVSSPLAVGLNGMIYVEHDQTICALDGQTGAKRWVFMTQGEVHSSPAIGVDGTVYIGTFDHYVYALNGQTGARKWAFDAHGQMDSPSVIGADGTVYQSTWAHDLYALDGQTGRERWSCRMEGDVVVSSPAIGADGTLYFGSDINIVYALDGKTGKTIWASGTGGVLHSSPAIGQDGTVYIGCCDGIVYAFRGCSKGGPPKGSPWPMFSGNVRHTGQAISRP